MSRSIGFSAERNIVSWLQNLRFHVFTVNYAFLPYGEIDIIGFDGRVLAFIEVKYRNNDRYGSATDMVHKLKQQKIINVANHFLQEYPKFENYESRFDVIGITGKKIEWIKAAYCLDMI